MVDAFKGLSVFLAIVAITGLTGMAMKCGLDGTVAMFGITAIAGLAGFQMSKLPVK